MALGSMDEFLAVLEHSKLLKPEEFAEVQRLAQEATDPPELAKTLVRKGTLTRWQAGQLLAGRSKCTVGKYKLLELLGRGGMGSVYLGEHVMMNRRVALKIIPRHIGKDPAGLERFLAEARTIASLDHPNVVQAYSVDNEGDQYYLVMEYVEGLDLKRRTDRTSVPRVGASGGRRPGSFPFPKHGPLRYQTLESNRQSSGRGKNPGHGPCPVGGPGTSGRRSKRTRRANPGHRRLHGP